MTTRDLPQSKNSTKKKALASRPFAIKRHSSKFCLICGLIKFRQKNALYCACCAKLVRKATAAKGRRSDAKMQKDLKEIGEAMEGVLEEWYCD